MINSVTSHHKQKLLTRSGKCKPLTVSNCRVADQQHVYTLYPKVIIEQTLKMAGYPIKILVILGEVFDGFLNCCRCTSGS